MATDKSPKEVVQARLKPEHVRMLDELAEAEERTRSQLIDLAVAEYLERHYASPKGQRKAKD